MVKLNVYYKNIYYTSIVESPSITLVSLVSNLGGNLGLFLGLSVLSLLEIFELIISLSTAVNHHVRSKSKIRPS